MDYFVEKCKLLKEFIFKRKLGSPKKRKITKFELYSEHIYNVLAWKDIGLTLKMFLFVNFAYWIFVSWNVKVYGAVFGTMLMFFLGDCYIDYQHPKRYVSYYSEDYDGFCNAAYDLLQALIKYRKENHFSFCFCNCIVFFIFYVASRSIPDYVLLYFVILGAFFLPLAVLCLPDETVAAIKQGFLRLGSQAALAEEELMPFLLPKNENQDDLDSLLTDRTQDSLTSSQASGVAMPSYLDVDNDSKSPSFTPTKGLTDSDTDSDSETKEIYFHSKHFNGNSSSEEEFAKGLQIPQPQGFSGILGQLGSTLVANVMTRSAPQFERTTSSSESDFEMINEDDMIEDGRKSS